MNYFNSRTITGFRLNNEFQPSEPGKFYQKVNNADRQILNNHENTVTAVKKRCEELIKAIHRNNKIYG